MIRTLFRTLLIIVTVVAVAAFILGHRWAAPGDRRPESDDATGTSGRAVDVDRARDAAADIGEKVAEGANEAQRSPRRLNPRWCSTAWSRPPGSTSTPTRRGHAQRLRQVGARASPSRSAGARDRLGYPCDRSAGHQMTGSPWGGPRIG